MFFATTMLKKGIPVEHLGKRKREARGSTEQKKETAQGNIQLLASQKLSSENNTETKEQLTSIRVIMIEIFYFIHICSIYCPTVKCSTCHSHNGFRSVFNCVIFKEYFRGANASSRNHNLLQISKFRTFLSCFLFHFIVIFV
mmetsp:Transcript_32507/g.39949  ORF Transcript_32507/g.39949 Transcript_32507/m.39949 type:complete len:142 (-) Transcript_32507:423-848(-)